MIRTRPTEFYEKMTKIIKNHIEGAIHVSQESQKTLEGVSHEYGYGSPLNCCRCTYDASTYELAVFVNLFSITIYDKRFDARKISSMRKFADNLGKEIAVYAKEVCGMADQIRQRIQLIEPAKVELKFTDCLFGKCKYPNLGYIRYAYLGLHLRYIHTPWMRIYFNRDEILYNKTHDQLVIDRDPVAYDYNHTSNTPPNVIWLPEDMWENAKEYIMANADKIFKILSGLPLNNTGMRENQNFKAVIVIRNGNELVDIEDLTDPNLDLYVLMFVNDHLSRKIHGFCRSFSNDVVHSIHADKSNYSETYKHVIGKTGNTADYTAPETVYVRKCTIVDSEEQDEYMSTIMNQLIARWKEKIDAGST